MKVLLDIKCRTSLVSFSLFVLADVLSDEDKLKMTKIKKKMRQKVHRVEKAVHSA